jgi:hypothetical protein
MRLELLTFTSCEPGDPDNTTMIAVFLEGSRLLKISAQYIRICHIHKISRICVLCPRQFERVEIGSHGPSYFSR